MSENVTGSSSFSNWVYYVGQKVVCLNGNWGQTTRGSLLQRRGCPNLPTEGCVYTIRELHMGAEELFIKLVEVVNPMNYLADGTPVEPIFQASRYKPLDEIKVDEKIRVAEPA